MLLPASPELCRYLPPPTEGRALPWRAPEEDCKLVKPWDSGGLAAAFSEAQATGQACRVFNARKSKLADRQISERRRWQRKDIDKIHVGFSSKYQGARLGVDNAFAVAPAFQKVWSSCRLGGVLRHQPFPKGPCWQGLLIDDFFAVSIEPDGNKKEDAQRVERLAYAIEVVVGLSEK
eukprot:Skav231796  [mRNA]  locus=scaffold734:116544:119327:+ [translate_table: standard]